MHLLSAQRIYSAHRYIARRATQCAVLHSVQQCTAPSTSLRTALHCQRCTVRNIVHPAPPSGGSRAQRKFAGEAERSGKRGYCAAFNESTASAATTRNASQGVRACICFQRSAYTARTATQRIALHSAQCCTARRATQRPALHCAQRFTAPSATLRPASHSAHYCTPRPEPCIARSIAQRPALHCTEHSEPRQGRMQQPNHRLRKGGCCVFFVVGGIQRNFQ